MKLGEALSGVTRLFIDTAPVIYFVEKNERYSSLMQQVFNRVDAGTLTAITSPITLAECLVHPIRRALPGLQQDFIDLIVTGENTVFVDVNEAIARQAAQLRVRHNLALDDAFQIAAALSARCEALLTNDAGLQRVTELAVIALDAIEPE